ncbi:conserved hypothetical protein [Verticillium alfalfae VaMs.102]|uniref:DUF7029 domain-containing protein n=1 Tax=Verticillium alfalfae (strain VaMs.102 / ATCC MYA-4576 / FGSC 10136) TaxID=526221 RepID=C9SL16_VERA1|nr:conserved hypothetical protein [Verticillium alfalfae VaMs.102]EEY19384.1 conserved hypothetical protein [Verticillium alfalfae VaMs.102]
MRFNSVAALLGAAVAVQALPAIEERAQYANSSIEAPKQQGFEVVIVYARPAEGCPAKPAHCDAGAHDDHKAYEAPSLPEPSIAEDHGDSGFKGSKTATLEHDAPMATLTPAIHWNYDTRPATNVIPIAPEKASEMFYGITDPSKAGHFAFLTYYFKSPSVNLDHCDHVTNVKYDSDELTIGFGSEEAYEHAVSTWADDEDVILIVYVPGCGDYAKGDRCYFQVKALSYKKGDLVIVAGGKPCHPDDVISKGETEWGWWTPRDDGYGPKAPSTKTLPGVGGQGTTSSARPTTTARAQNTQSGASFTWGGSSTSIVTATTVGGSSPSGSASAGPSASGSGSSPSNSQGPSGTSAPGAGSTSAGFAAAKPNCNAPVDTKYGLPSACWGELFDYDLDTDLGYEPLSAEYKTFALKLAPELDDYAEAEGETFDGDFWKTNKRGIRVLNKRFCGFLCDVVDNWKLPDSSSKDPDAKTLKDPETKQVTSPWGDSILLKAFGNQEGDENKKLNGYMNVFCVGCGVSGSAKLAGRAAWTPLGGVFTQGEVEVNTDIKFVLKVGIDAQMTYKQEFSHTLLNVGLPGLSYGVVTIGPRITVGSRVELEAEAKGKLLAGAEMGLQNAHVLIDFVNPSNSKRDGWDPYFKPVFEAEGEIMLAATLGLPIGLRCGLQIGAYRNRDPTASATPSNPATPGKSNLPTDPENPTGPTDPEGPTDPTDPENPTDPTDPEENPEDGGEENPEDGGEENPEDGGEENPEDGGEENPEDGDGGSEEDFENSDFQEATKVRARQATTSAVVTAPANITGKVVDITSKIKGNGTSVLSYTPETLPNRPYNTSTGYDLALLVDPEATTMIVSCSNGNMYAFGVDGEDNEHCSEMWSSKNDVLVTDGGQRLMHYYNNSMSAVGVSRLRLDDQENIPSAGVVVAFAPYSEDDKTDDYFYLAVDPNEQVFYLLVCDYEDNSGSKIFLAKDPEDGAAMLMSEDLQYTVTGGKVTGCYPLTLMQGEYAAGDDYTTLSEGF